MAHRKRPVDFRLTRIAATDPEDLEFNIVEQDRLYSLQWVVGIDETNAITRMRFLKKVGETEHFYAEQDAPSADELVWLDQAPVFLQTGETFIIRFEGPTVADKLKMYLSGYFFTLGNPGHLRGQSRHTPDESEQ